MGNCLALIRPSMEEKVLRIVKMDGKILEYRAPVLVKDLLFNFDGYGIGISQNASQHLPSYHELKVGHMYYLLSSPVKRSLIDEDPPVGLKRIKVVISKKQLQELMAKTISVEEVISGLHKGEWDGIDSTKSWSPKLETIPEGSE
ncbi:uncharacterized protein LOC143888764 [Tasmannia lanceolata]|uniref:uncharacterized protein LOC143888764 n=1 Tax=Tasmannia lanceolata TaxID=3420 RepID=UPI004062A4BE